MANIIHSSKSRSHQQHHHQLAPQPREAWPPYQKLVISTQNGVRLQDAKSQNALVELDNVQSMSVAISSDAGCRVLVAHNDSILLRDHFKRRDTLYRLRGPGAEVSSIAFLPNSDEFLFWSKHSNMICGYSQTLNRLTDYSCVHPSEPTHVVVSVHGRYVISTSRKPATVYLQDMRWPKTQIPIRVRASVRQQTRNSSQPTSHVVVAAFHPSQRGHFLLAYADGALSIHNANRIIHFRRAGTTSDGLKRFCASLHHNPIVAAQFLDGHKMRVVTLGKRGKCRITDFEHGINHVVTWEVGTGCLSMAIVLPVTKIQVCKGNSTSSESTAISRPPPAPAAHTQITDHWIAIGCADGSVKTYSAIGLLQCHQLGVGGQAVKQLQWIPNYIAPNLSRGQFKSSTIDIDWPPAKMVRSLARPMTPPSSVVVRNPFRRRPQYSTNTRHAQSQKEQIVPEVALPASSQNMSIADEPETRGSRVANLQRLREQDSRPGLFESLRRKRQLAEQAGFSPPRKNLNCEPPGSQPREAQYLPAEWLSSPTVDPSQVQEPQHSPAKMATPSIGRATIRSRKSPVQIREGHHKRPASPTPLEDHLLNGALLALKQRNEGTRVRTRARTVSTTSLASDQQSTHTAMTRLSRSTQAGRCAKHGEHTREIANESHVLNPADLPPNQDIIPPSPSPSPSLPPPKRSRSHHKHHLHVPGHFIDSDDDDVPYEDATEHHGYFFGSVLDGGERFVYSPVCNCECADVVRGEMTLVRSEIASLRRAVWAVGTGTGTGMGGGGVERMPWFGVGEREQARGVVGIQSS